MALVDYLVARDGLPAPRGSAYDYVLAGDGLFIAARNRFLEVRILVASATVRGLPPLYPSFGLRTQRIPSKIWEQIDAFTRAWSVAHRELYLAVVHDDAHGYQLVLPRQRTSHDRVVYRPVPNTVLAIHSHHVLPAFFSATDDADEQGLGLDGVVGRLDRDRPEVALRVGAYGYRMPVPWDAVFAGDRAPFRDVTVDQEESTGADDDVQN